MAIKVVNGLIDVAALAKDGDRAALPIDTAAEISTGNSLTPQAKLDSYFGLDSKTAGSLSPTAEAALEKLKRYSAGRVREEIRDISQAQDLASWLARTIIEELEESRSAHSELATSTAEEHLMH
jgi:hypothetical protein